MTLVAVMSDGILRLTARGTATKDFTQQLAVIVGQHSPAPTPTRILVDLRELDISMSILRLEDAMRALVHAREHHWRRTAVLYRAKSTTVVERFQFLENLSSWLGIALMISTDEDAAIEWLHTKKP